MLYSNYWLSPLIDIFKLAKTSIFKPSTVSSLWIVWLRDYKNIKQWTDARALDRRLSLGEKYVFPFIGNKQPKDITPKDIIKCLEYCSSKTTQSAPKVLTALNQFLRWCDSRNFRNTATRLPTDREFLEPLLNIRLKTTNNHYPAIDWRDVPRFVALLVNSSAKTVSAQLLLFSILTVSRGQPVRLATWNEINFELAEWRIPASHMKGKQGNNLPHDVPLSRQALKILDAIQNKTSFNYCDLIFVRNKQGLSSTAVRKLIQSINKKVKLNGEREFIDPYQQNRVIVPHGFRAAFATWAQENNKNMMIVERCLAHKDPTDRHNGAYRRGVLIEQRRVLLQEWADYCFGELEK